MACFHPLKMFVIGEWYDAENKKHNRTKIVSYKVHHLEENQFGEWLPVENEKVGECRAVAFRHFEIPCGKCIGCRLEYSRQWANRLMLEYKYHDPDKCWFVTLTYDNENVPVNYFIDSETSQQLPSLSLKKDDAKEFCKTLRNGFRDCRIRYYLCGEYGDQTCRPHLHAILFNVPLDSEKLVRWSTTSQGFTLYKCPELEELWCRGNVLVSPVSWETCAYTARYVTKKLNGDAAKVYETFNIEPPFSLMSRRPGIGRLYFEEHPDVIEKGLHVSAGSRAINCDAPRYYKKLFKLTNELDSAIMAYEGTVRQDEKVSSVMNHHSKAADDYMAYLKSQEYAQKAAAAVLARSDN